MRDLVGMMFLLASTSCGPAAATGFARDAESSDDGSTPATDDGGAVDAASEGIDSARADAPTLPTSTDGGMCVPGTGTCPAGEYCQPDQPCGPRGTCVPIQGAPTDYAPVCGCDGATYWNAVIAASLGANIRGTGGCIDNSLKCDNVANFCPAGLLCGYTGGQQLACNGAGTCWGLPSKCPAAGPKVPNCDPSGAACVPLCETIADGGAYYTLGGPTCQ